MATYVALIRKEPHSDYGVDFPDFPGCVTAGRTLDEAVAMAHEALAGHAALMVEEGEKLPAPSRVETVLRDPHNKQGRRAVSRLRARRSVKGGSRERPLAPVSFGSAVCSNGGRGLLGVAVDPAFATDHFVYW